MAANAGHFKICQLLLEEGAVVDLPVKVCSSLLPDADQAYSLWYRVMVPRPSLWRAGGGH